jgi:hypothetical protein
MFKRKIAVFLLLSLFLLLCGCSGQAKQAQKSEPPAPKEKTEYTATEVLQAFKDAGLPLGRVEEYTAETDPNGLLGRPNQYIGKLNFEDTRKGDPESDTLTGGTVEVFDSQDNLATRKKYTEAISESASMFAQYIYAHKNILLRIDHQLTPDQAKEYEAVLNNL